MSLKKERRRERLRMAGEEALAKELSRTREIREDFRKGGVGFRRVQVLVMPPFDPVLSWDIRKGSPGKPDDLRLYHATGPAGQRETLSPGYRRVDCPVDTLAEFMNSLSGIRVCPLPPPATMAGLDGTSYEIGFFGNLYSEARLRWWGDAETAPPDWAELVAVVEDMVSAFSRCAVLDGID